MDNARLEAKNTTDKAQMEAEAIITEANQQRAQIRQSILRLLDRRDEIIAGISSYLDNAKSSVEKFSKDEMSIFSLPAEEKIKANVQEVDESELEEDSKNGSRFTLDEEELTESEEDKDGFPPGSDRLNDILDEID